MERIRIMIAKIQASPPLPLSEDSRGKIIDQRVQEAESRAQGAERRAQEAECRAIQAEARVREAEMEKEAQVREAHREKEARIKEAEMKKEVEIRKVEREKEAEIREAESRAQVAKREKAAIEVQVEEAEGRARQTEVRARQAEVRARQAEVRARLAEVRARQEEDSARQADVRAREAESRAEGAERQREIAEVRASEAEGRVRCLETQWVVERQEIVLLEEELGRGGWATVKVATFRGASVAAKCIHRGIISHHNIRLFKREMDMAARIRHPNLLQFIGASLEGQMVILTELMPTSLRRELERNQHNYMSPELVISIGLDVIRALNYLHLFQPHPLIHRDISSANVLLEPLVGGRWRAKVSDYGTVNLLQQLDTVCPGNPSYAAPEAEDPSQQSPKMDIFSFGVLLMEMLTGEFPASDERGRLLSMIFHQPLLSLVHRCLKQLKEDRPNASDIITILNSNSNPP